MYKCIIDSLVYPNYKKHICTQWYTFFSPSIIPVMCLFSNNVCKEWAHLYPFINDTYVSFLVAWKRTG